MLRPQLLILPDLHARLPPPLFSILLPVLVLLENPLRRNNLFEMPAMLIRLAFLPDRLHVLRNFLRRCVHQLDVAVLEVGERPWKAPRWEPLECGDGVRDGEEVGALGVARHVVPDVCGVGRPRGELFDEQLAAIG
ncbi:hypothetical protein BD309DRAFT_328001 [Dichomitus squalens]|nr:hypothetical protein BD309DRAFT_328001 [Dichomitus squalens]